MYNNELQFIKLQGKFKDNISTIFTEKKTFDKELISLLGKANDIIKSKLQDDASANNCKYLYVALVPIFREIKYYNTESTDDNVVKKDILKQAKTIIRILTAELYKDKIFISDDEVLNEIALYVDEVKRDNDLIRYNIKRGLSIYNGIKRYIELNNNHFDNLPMTQNVLYVFENILNVYLNKIDKPFVEPLLKYSQKIKDSLEPIYPKAKKDMPIAMSDEYNNDSTVENDNTIENDNTVEIGQFSKNGELIRKFKSSREAERQTGIAQSNICSCCKGKLKSCGGYIWRYI